MLKFQIFRKLRDYDSVNTIIPVIIQNMKLILALLLSILAWVNASNTTCVCTTVPCPTSGQNSLTENGGGIGTYTYSTHNGHAVVTSVKATITKANLDMGTDTTSCTQDYSRSLDDVSIIVHVFKPVLTFVLPLNTGWHQGLRRWAHSCSSIGWPRKPTNQYLPPGIFCVHCNVF